MTLEEMQAQLEAQQKQIEAMQAENAQLKTNQSEQNSYITKLEQQLKAAPTQSAAPAADNKILQQYLQKSMRKDVVDEAYATLRQNVDQATFECLKPDLDEFLKKNMTTERTTVAYIIDAFTLVHGKALYNKNHPIHKLGTAQGTPPAAAPAPAAAAPAPQAAQPAQGQPPVQQVSDKLRNFFPPQMTPSDANAAQTPPTGNPGIKNTKDAISSFRNKILSGGGNAFS